MSTLELNAELYRAMAEIADNETMLDKVLKYVRSLTLAKDEAETPPSEKPYKVIPVSPEITKWRGCVSFTEREIEDDPRLKALIDR